MRTGNELMQATKPFAKEDRAKSWRLITVTLVLVAGCFVGVLAAPGWPLKLAFGGLLSVASIRLFMFYHDYLHGALLRRSKLASVIMTLLGVYFLAVRSVWRETHNYHHKNNAKMTGSAIGSFPVVTFGMWKGMSGGQRFAYRAIRHPLSVFGGYFTVFLLGMTLSPFRRDPKKHWGGPISVVAHVGVTVAVAVLVDIPSALCAVTLPAVVTFGIGSYLFFVQHNFPDMKLRGRRDWDYTYAAIRSSSMFDMSPLMHWVTGNIGYHHVHHLNHRIPFYNLPAAMAAVPELQTPGRTSWKLRDISACCSLSVWDPEQDRMLTWAELNDRMRLLEPALSGA